MDFFQIVEEIIKFTNRQGFMALASIITVLGGIPFIAGVVSILLSANRNVLVKRKPNEMIKHFIYDIIIYVMDLFSWFLLYIILFVMAYIGILLLDFSQIIRNTKCIYPLFLGLLVILFGVYIKNRKKEPLNFIESIFTTIFCEIIFAIIFSVWKYNVNTGYIFLLSVYILLILILWWSDIKYKIVYDKWNIMLKVLSTLRITVLVFSFVDMSFITKVWTVKKISIIVVVWDLVAAVNYFFRNIWGKKIVGDVKIIDTANGQFVSRERIVRKKNDIVEFYTTSYEKYFMDSKEICSIKYNIYNRRRRKRLFYIWTCKQKSSEKEEQFDKVRFINDSWVELVNYIYSIETVTVVPRDKIDYIKRERRK